MRKFEPLAEGDVILKLTCPGCSVRFELGDVITLVPIGPGIHEDSQARAREGRPYNAISLPTHWVCATGGDKPPV